MSKRLFVDMDGTLAKFHDEANYLERMYEEDFFYNLGSFENMVSGVKLFMEQHPDVDVYIISSCVESAFCIHDKNRWLDEHLNIPTDHRIFPPVGSSKADYIPGGVTKDDFLLDDYNKGLNQFMYDGGSAIKCHNNINQQGLGAYGGSSGNLWVGPMVHTDDKPEMISAEIAHSMGLEYELNKVVEAYPEVNTVLGIEGRNPLNDIRFALGKEEFYDFKLQSSSGTPFYVPGHQLRSICINLYNDSDYLRRAFNKDASSHLAFSKDVQEALERSEQPMVGRVDYLHTNGKVAYSRNYYSKEEMDDEISDCRDSGVPITEAWYITVKPKSLSEIKNFFDLADRFYFDYNLEEEAAADLAKSMLTPVSQRSPSQSQALIEFWHTKRIPESLPDFLGIDDLSSILITVEPEKSNRQQIAPEPPKRGSSLDSIISNAEYRSSLANDNDLSNKER